MNDENISTKTTDSNTKEGGEVTDLFNWANLTDAVKNNLKCEMFVFNRHYTPLSVAFSDELYSQIRTLFLFDVVNQVNLGAGTGMSVREFEMSDAERDVVLRTDVDKVLHLATLKFNIEKERDKVETFSETDHEMRKMKGMIVRFINPAKPDEPFYIIKALTPAATLPGLAAWEINGGTIGEFKADAGMRIPTDNQVLVVGQDIFIFAAKKFENLFKYNYKEQRLAEAKVAEIEKSYKLSFPEGLSLQELLKDKPGLVRKLQDVEVGQVTQDQTIEYADEMELELMTDTDNSIIIMDGRDLDMFVGLINEDYITSERTGKRYKITKKKLLDDPSGGEPPRG